jgi:hypothetical protein
VGTSGDETCSDRVEKLRAFEIVRAREALAGKGSFAGGTAKAWDLAAWVTGPAVRPEATVAELL